MSNTEQSESMPGISVTNHGKPCLFLLTKQFPFQQKEQYVAHELEYLAGEFSRVYVYPHDHFSQEPLTEFRLPENVEVIDLNRNIIPAGKFKTALSFIRAFFFEIRYTHNKWWMLKNLRYFYSIYATQYALGEGLMRFQTSRGIERDASVFYSYWFSSSALCLAILKSRGRIDRFVSRAHSLDLYHEGWGMINDIIRIPPFRNFKQKYVNRIFTITDHGKKFLERTSKVKAQVQTKYLGVRDFGLNPESQTDIFTIVTCSGIDENKRIHKLGESLSRLKTPVRWVHFGDGALKQLALDSVTSKNVIFDLRGHTPNEEIRRFYHENHVDLFVNISKVEGLPVTIMEAMSHGVPVLATNCSGTPEVVDHGLNGVIIPVDFTDGEIDQALGAFMNGNVNLKVTRLHARQKFVEKFDADRNYKFFAEELKNKVKS